MPTIVWLEDDAPVIAPVVDPLVEAGYQVLEIHTVADALEKVEIIRSADVVLMDIILPLGEAAFEAGPHSGIDLLRHLREKEQIDTPVVIFTVIDVEPYRSELEQDLRVADILKKPVLPSELKRRIDRAVATRQPG